MAHFAELNENNIVQQVIVVHNNELLDENGLEQEQKGIDFCVAHYGGTWIQTSYNGSFRGNYALPGDTYNFNLDLFIKFKPFNSFILDEKTGEWVPPITRPEHEPGFFWVWKEDLQNWIKTEIFL